MTGELRKLPELFAPQGKNLAPRGEVNHPALMSAPGYNLLQKSGFLSQSLVVFLFLFLFCFVFSTSILTQLLTCSECAGRLGSGEWCENATRLKLNISRLASQTGRKR